MGYKGEHIYSKFRKPVCDRCGKRAGTRMHHVHHKDRDKTNNAKENLRTLCHQCHAKVHYKAGDWGRGRLAVQVCEVCGKEFTNPNGKKKATCSKKCFSKIVGLTNNQRKAFLEKMASGSKQSTHDTDKR